MGNVYSLVDLKADIEKEFAPLEIELGRGKVLIRNVLRLSKDERTEVLGAIKKFSGEAASEDVDEMFDAIRTVLRVCSEGGKGDALVTAIGDDLALAMKIMNLWTEATQPGEARNSPA